MPNLDDNKNETLDALVLAAMIEDPEEDDEDKALREKYFGDADDSDDDEDTKVTKPEKKPVEAADDSDDDTEEEDEEHEDADKKTAKPADQDDDAGDDDDAANKPKKTDPPADEKVVPLSQAIIKDGYKPRQSSQYNYNPLDYSTATEFDKDVLQQDRDKFGAAQMAKGAEIASYWSEQDRFFNDLGTEAKILESDPKFKFLDQTDKKNFDADKAAEINESFLKIAGYKAIQKTDAQGNPLFDSQTRQPIVMHTVEHPEISFDKYVRRYVANMDKWSTRVADDKVEEVTKAITSQRKKQGIRPTNGGGRKTLSALNLGDISNMTDEEFEANEAEIDRQIAAML